MKNYRKISPKRLKKLISNYQKLIIFYKKEKEWWEKNSNHWFDSSMTYADYYVKQMKRNKILLYWNIIMTIILVFECIAYLVK